MVDLAPPPADAHLARRRDVALWRPYIAAALARHGLPIGDDLTAGDNPTHPTFLTGALVIKLYGGAPFWRASHDAELAANACVSRAPGLRAPELVAHGALFTGDAPWPYLVTRRVPGTPWSRADLDQDTRLAVAADLGAQVRILHDLDPALYAGVTTRWDHPPLLDALARSSFPPHLFGQVDAFLARLAPATPVLTHGDLVDHHVFVSGGRLSGVIDWGDATVTDRHYEVAKLHFHTFGADPELLARFLDAASWDPDADFPHAVLGWAIRRQADGLAQHHGFDLFNHLPRLLPLDTIRSIDELAERLFGRFC
jgi:hypothetical protein